ncbi:hypothetical protein BT67DRAFT_155371 [Trichocladium antarcticum]|uniref:Uncharacterized protein n=1 Tax=Trichocladium antarcticum TaxID=1450529 RepID=A0AAN6ZAT5_9PEZI|nr:hypothetical protein BT67DRAFT_155371 [Trichocladium antarcticum]
MFALGLHAPGVQMGGQQHSARPGTVEPFFVDSANAKPERGRTRPSVPNKAGTWNGHAKPRSGSGPRGTRLISPGDSGDGLHRRRSRKRNDQAASPGRTDATLFAAHVWHSWGANRQRTAQEAGHEPLDTPRRTRQTVTPSGQKARETPVPRAPSAVCASPQPARADVALVGLGILGQGLGGGSSMAPTRTRPHPQKVTVSNSLTAHGCSRVLAISIWTNSRRVQDLAPLCCVAPNPRTSNRVPRLLAVVDWPWVCRLDLESWTIHPAPLCM